MSERNNKKDFKEFLEEYTPPLERGAIVRGTVVKITSQSVLVNVGSKTEGIIPIEEFFDDGKLTIEEGDEVEAKVVNISDAFAQIRLSTLDLKQEKALVNAKEALKNETPIPVKINGRSNRGFIGNYYGINVFIPLAHIDMKGHIKEGDFYSNKILQCNVLKIDEENKSILASHRLYLESLENKKRKEFIDKLKVGDIVRGKVKVLKKYGVFVEIGPVDAFLYKGNISWGKVKEPTDYLEVDDIIEVKVMQIDKEKEKIEVSLKDKSDDPWEHVRDKYPEGSNVKGTVITKKNNGFVLEIEEGIDGFLPNEEVSWLKKIDKRIERRSIVEGRVIGYDDKKRRVLISLRLIENNPWETIRNRHPEGSIVKGTIKGVKDFGIFVDFGEPIDGLIRINDLSWTKTSKNINELYKVGDIVEAKVLKIDPLRERIQLGIKQLTKDPWSEVDKLYPKGAVVEGQIKNIENKFVELELPGGLSGIVPISELDDKKILPKEKFKLGDSLKALVTDIDHKRKVVILSVRLYQLDLEKKDISDYMKDYDEDDKKFSLGAILKDKLNK
jgi:ribosomal protein S1